MSLTKENLIDAHEQGLSINTKNGNIKIVAILNDIYGVNHFNSNQVKWWMFENFERNEAKIEQPKPKIDLSILKEGEIYYAKGISNYEYIFIFDNINDYKIIVKKGLCVQDNFETSSFIAKKNNLIELRLPTELELELFYSKFPELKPKKYIQGFEVKDGYNDVVMVSDDNYGWYSRILKSIANNRFIDNNGNAWMFARYPKKEEINEIKFID